METCCKGVKKKKILFDYFLSLPTTSPLEKGDITRLIQKFSQTKYDVLLCATETNRYPHYNMVLRKNIIQPIMKKSKGIKENNILDLTTVGYITKPKFIMNSKDI